MSDFSYLIYDIPLAPNITEPSVVRRCNSFSVIENKHVHPINAFETIPASPQNWIGLSIQLKFRNDLNYQVL